MFLDPLVFRTADGDIGFDVFKGRRARSAKPLHAFLAGTVNRFDILVFCSTYSNSRSSKLFPITFNRGTEWMFR